MDNVHFNALGVVACSKLFTYKRIEMKVLFLLFFTLLSSHISVAQDSASSIRLEYISNSFPIKIDAGGAFYTYDTVNLNKHKYILVINDASNWITAESHTRTAFMKVPSKSDYIYLHAPGKTHAAGMDTATFKGQGYVIKLNTRKGKKIDAYNDLYKGSITIKYNKEQKVIKVQGVVPK